MTQSKRAEGSRWKASHWRPDGHKPRPSGSSKVKGSPRFLEPALLGLPPVTTAWLHPATFLPFPSLHLVWETDTTQEAPGCCALALVKPPSLSPTLSPHTAGTGLASLVQIPGELGVQVFWCLAWSTALLVWGGTGTLPVIRSPLHGHAQCHHFTLSRVMNTECEMPPSNVCPLCMSDLAPVQA